MRVLKTVLNGVLVVVHFAVHDFLLRFPPPWNINVTARCGPVGMSGTNRPSGNAFFYGRDKALNAKTFSESVNNREKQDYRRWQFGGSAGGPIVQNKIHYFGAFERTPPIGVRAPSSSGSCRTPASLSWTTRSRCRSLLNRRASTSMASLMPCPRSCRPGRRSPRSCGAATPAASCGATPARWTGRRRSQRIHCDLRQGGST